MNTTEPETEAMKSVLSAAASLAAHALAGLAAIAVALLAFGCAPASGVGAEAAMVGGDAIDQTPTAVRSRVQGPHTITWAHSSTPFTIKKLAKAADGSDVDASYVATDDKGEAILGESGTVTTSGDLVNLLELDGAGFKQTGSGPSGHGAVLKLKDGRLVSFFSSTAMRTKIVTKPDGSEELTIDSDPTKPTASYGSNVLAPVIAYYRSLSEEKRAAFVAGVQANSEVTKALVENIAPGSFDLLRAVLVPLVTK